MLIELIFKDGTKETRCWSAPTEPPPRYTLAKKKETPISDAIFTEDGKLPPFDKDFTVHTFVRIPNRIGSPFYKEI